MNLVVEFAVVSGTLLVFSVTLLLYYLRRMIRERTMHVQERQARFTMLAFVVVVVGYGILAGLFRFPWEPSIGVFGLFGLVGLSGLIGRSERREGKVIMDERDREIDLRASLGGFAIFWGCLCIAWTIWFIIVGPNGVVAVPIGRLGLTLFAGMIIIFTVRAAATLVMYRRDAVGEAN